MDPLLQPFLTAPDARTADERLGELLHEQAAPLVRRVVFSRLGSAAADAEDVCSQVLLQLLVRLRQKRADAALAEIDAFMSYVAAAARHGCDQQLRSRFPLRWRLRSRILYVLERDPRLAVWKDANGNWTCGLSEWRDRPATGALPSSDQLTGIPTSQLRTLLLQAFGHGGAPVDLNALVDVTAAAWNIPRQPLADNANVEGLSDSRLRPDERLEQRSHLARVWTQVCELPLRQRHALLLNLRDDAMSLFLTSGAASLRDVAVALEMPVQTFAALWNELPLADNTIAARLGCTRQQVINLRMAARKRLGHRLGVSS